MIMIVNPVFHIIQIDVVSLRVKGKLRFSGYNCVSSFSSPSRASFIELWGSAVKILEIHGPLFIRYVAYREVCLNVFVFFEELSPILPLELCEESPFFESPFKGLDLDSFKDLDHK